MKLKKGRTEREDEIKEEGIRRREIREGRIKRLNVLKKGKFVPVLN
jgi:hypothetical protein